MLDLKNHNVEKQGDVSVFSVDTEPMALRYDIEADWLLLKTCNFRCDYCFFSAEQLGTKLRTAASNQAWAGAFDGTGKSWLLHLTGGEPTLYPDFADLCVRLTRRHYLSLNTNLSHPSIERFAEAVDPGRVHYVNAALHSLEREKKQKTMGAFIERVHLLRQSGFVVLTSAVATPEVLSRFDEVSRVFAREGLSLLPKMLQGKHGGRNYPDGYTTAERDVFRAHSARASAEYMAERRRMGELPTINMFADAEYIGPSVGPLGRLYRTLRGGDTYHGALCDAGSRFVVIHPDGKVRRCSSDEDLGNILSGDLRLLDGPKNCDTNFCFYYCEKYAAPRR